MVDYNFIQSPDNELDDMFLPVANPKTRAIEDLKIMKETVSKTISFMNSLQSALPAIVEDQLWMLATIDDAIANFGDEV
jgi:hypothetical protein